MEFHVGSHLDAMNRSVCYLERDGRPASGVTLTREFATSLEDLWDAVTNSKRIPRWFAVVSGELKLGGRYQIEGNASGAVTACEPLSLYAVTWEFAGDVSWVEVRLADTGSGSVQLSLTHTALLSPFWDQYGPGAVGVGWEMGFLGLALYLAQPDWTKPDEMEFATSADGKAFITGSSEGWAAASIAAGTDTENAQAAARNTTAFYTGEQAETT